MMYGNLDMGDDYGEETEAERLDGDDGGDSEEFIIPASFNGMDVNQAEAIT